MCENGVCRGNIQSSGNFTLPNPFTVGGDTTVRGSNNLTISGPGTLSPTSHLFIVTNSGTTTFSGILSGEGELIQESSTGTLVLTGANTYTGPTLLISGTLSVGSNTALGTGLLIGAGAPINSPVPGTIQSNSAFPITLGNPIVIQGPTTVGTSFDLTFAGSVFSGSVLTISNTGRTTFSGTLGGAGTLSVGVGTGELVLTGTNTYAGSTMLFNGTLTVGSNTALGTGQLIVDNGFIRSNAPVTLANPFTVNVGMTVGGSNNLTFSGLGTLSTGSRLTVTNTGTTIFTSNIGGPGALTEAAVTGTLALPGPNTYLGGTTLTSGTLTIGNDTALATGPLAFNGGILQSSSTAAITLANPFTVGGPVAIGGSNFLSFSGAGSLTAGFTLTVTNTARTDFSGNLSGPGGLTVGTGTGQVSLFSANAYTGSTTILSGTLLVEHDNAVPSSSAVTVASGGTFALDNFRASVDTIGSLAGEGNVILTASGEFIPPLLMTNGNNASTTFSGVISGSGGSLVKEGTGTLTLAGTNTFTGVTIVSAGTLLVNGSLPSNVTVNGGALLGGSGTVATITATGSVSPGGPGTGTLHSKDATFNAGSSFIVKFNGTTASSGYDQLSANGPVSLTGNPTLMATAGFAASSGNTFAIITSSSGITGTFNGLANNAVLNISGQAFRINYTFNSVVLTRTSTATTTTLSSSPNPSFFGQPITFTATITLNASSMATPTGTVQFQIDGSNFGSPVTISTSGGVTTATINAASLAAGTHSVTASYSGDGNFDSSIGTLSGGQVINKASTNTVVTSSANPSVFGQPVIFTATVTVQSPGGGTPSGTVQFQIDGTNFGDPVPLNVGVADSGPINSLSVSTGHTITALYSGQSNFSSNTGTLTQTVNRALTITTVTASVNSSVSGLPVTFTATVKVQNPGVATPTGTITFRDGTTTLGTATIDNAAIATLTLATQAGANHSVTVDYSGDVNFNSSSSSTSPPQDFVTMLYEDVLLRPPDAAGLNFWVQQLASGITRAAVAMAFETSAEYRGVEVDIFYQTFLKRPADAAGRASWVNTLVSGQSEGNVIVAFVTSAEYRALNHSNTADYVNGLYQDVLGRPADSAGSAGWQDVLQRGTESPTQVALSFLSSMEAYQVAIDYYYQHFLHRPADTAGQQFALDAMQSGRATPTGISALFLASDEYFARTVNAVGS